MPRRGTLLAAMAIVLVVAATAWALVARDGRIDRMTSEDYHQPTPQDSDRSNRAALEALARDMRQLRNDQAQVSQRIVEISEDRQRPAQPAATEGDLSAPLSREELARLDRAIASEHVRVLRAELSQRAVPDDWGQQAQTDLRGLFSGDRFTGAWLSGVSCGHDMCELNVELNSIVALDEITAAMSSEPVFSGGGYFHMTSDPGEQPPTYAFFIARPGYTLPPPARVSPDGQTVPQQ